MNYSSYFNRLDRLETKARLLAGSVLRRPAGLATASISLNNSRSACVIDRSRWCNAKNWRFGKLKLRSIREPASIEAATTNFDNTAAPAPSSTAARTASFDGNSSTISISETRSPAFAIAFSKRARVADPGSRNTHRMALRSAFDRASLFGRDNAGLTTRTISSSATGVTDSA